MSKMLSVINFTLIYWLLLFLFPLLYFISIWMSVAALFCVMFPQLKDAHPQRPQMLLLQYRQHQLIFTLGLGIACSTHMVANFHLLPCRRYLQCQHVWPVCKSHDQEQFAASLLYPALFVSVWPLFTWILNWVFSMNITWARQLYNIWFQLESMSWYSKECNKVCLLVLMIKMQGQCHAW